MRADWSCKDFKSINSLSDNIYIDCSPTTDGDTDTYMSKNLDNLRLFDIKNFNLWLFRFLTVFVIMIVIFLIIKLFGISTNVSSKQSIPL